MDATQVFNQLGVDRQTQAELNAIIASLSANVLLAAGRLFRQIQACAELYRTARALTPSWAECIRLQCLQTVSSRQCSRVIEWRWSGTLLTIQVAIAIHLASSTCSPSSFATPRVGLKWSLPKALTKPSSA